MTPTGPQRREYEKLLDAVFCDTADSAVLERIDVLLQEDESFRNTYVKTLQLRAELEWDTVAHPQPVVEVANRLPWLSQRVGKFFTRPTPFSMSVSALVIGLLITVMGFLTPPVYRGLTGQNGDRERHSYRIVAEVSGTYEAVWGEGAFDTRKGAQLVAGRRLVLASGKAEITMHDGTRFILTGPCDIVITDASHCTLARGMIAVDVAAGAEGFQVQTPLGTVTDLGTKFGVDVGRDGREETYVLEGSVEVAWSPDGGRADHRQQLVAGQSLALSRGKASPEIYSGAPEWFALQLPPPRQGLTLVPAPASYTVSSEIPGFEIGGLFDAPISPSALGSSRRFTEWQWSGLEEGPHYVTCRYDAPITANAIVFSQRMGTDPAADKTARIDLWFSDAELTAQSLETPPDVSVDITNTANADLTLYHFGRSVSGQYVVMRFWGAPHHVMTNIGGSELRLANERVATESPPGAGPHN